MSTKQENKKSLLEFAEKQRMMTKEQVRMQMNAAFLISFISFVVLILNFAGIIPIENQLIEYLLLAILFISCISIIVNERFHH